MGSVLVAGTSSDAGKSVMVAGLCRALTREGLTVAPFKAQNMSLNSFVTLDGAEIGRAQAAQAAAAGVEPEAAMNPILLKPGSDTTSHLIVMGREVGEQDAASYWGGDRSHLLDVVVDAHRSLAERFDAVVCEGAGSPAEINLRSGDLVNLGFARAAGVPVVVVGDIDRGGVFASFVGTLAVLSPEDQAMVAGFVVNRFRGDVSLLEPGLVQLAELTGRPTFGVVPYVEGIGIDAEDAIDHRFLGSSPPPLGEQTLRVAVVAFPRMSNHTDVDPLVVEPGVEVRFVRTAGEVAAADVVVLPGTRATVADLGWLRSRGLDAAVAAHAASGRAVMGICGGYQMLGSTIDDTVESRSGRVAGLGLLPVTTEFGPSKVLARPSAHVDGETVSGYEIHYGRVRRHGGDPLLGDEGCRLGSVTGTLWHGVLENDAFRRRLLAGWAHAAGRRFVAAADRCFAEERRARIERLGDLVADHLDMGAVRRLLEHGAPPAPTLHLTLQ